MNKTITGIRFKSEVASGQEPRTLLAQCVAPRVNLADLKAVGPDILAWGNAQSYPKRFEQANPPPAQSTARLTTADAPERTAVMLAGTTVAAGGALGLPPVAIQVGMSTARLLDAMKWGGHLIKLTPWGRVASLVMGAGMLAYERGVLKKSFLVTEPKGLTDHALLAPPPGLNGGNEEFPAAYDHRPTILGGALLPALLQGSGLEGCAPVQGLEAMGVHEGGGKIEEKLALDGYAPYQVPKGGHILWSQTQDEAPQRLLRPGMAEWPSAPKPKMEFADQVSIKFLDGSKNNVGFEYKFRVLPWMSTDLEANIEGSVYRGAMNFAVLALGDRRVRPSGTDLVVNVINALHEKGVAVYGIEARWPNVGTYTDNNESFYNALYKEVKLAERSYPDDRLFAASQTFTGKIAKRYGLSPHSVVINPFGGVQAYFENPLYTRLYGSIYERK